MKKVLTYFILLAILVTACKKHHSDPSSTGNNSTSPIVAKWNIVSVTTYAYDANGLLNNGVNVYPGQPSSYFQFNPDNTWLESLVPDSTSGLGITGTYTLTSDSTFTLVNPLAVQPAKPCTIVSLTGSSFVFSNQRQTVFNGTDSGYIKYVFLLSK